MSFHRQLPYRNIHLARILLGIIALTLLLGVSVAGAQDTPDYDPFFSTSNLNTLKTQASKAGSVRVIVGLNQPSGAQSAPLTSAQALSTAATPILSAQNALLSSMAGQNIQSVQQFRYTPFVAMSVDAPALDALHASPLVSSISADALLRPDMNTSAKLVGAKGTNGAHAMGITGKGVAVAVLDTGVDKMHSTLKGRIVAEGCFGTSDYYDGTYSLCPGAAESSTAPGSGKDCSPKIYGCGHGTHVAGTVAGSNRVYTGVAPRADIIAVKVFSEWVSWWCYPDISCAVAYTSDVIAGLEHVLDLKTYEGIKVAAVNMSLGGSYTYLTRSSCDAANLSIKYTIDALRSAGIATVVSSGNSYDTEAISAPACISSAVSVGAVNDQDAVAPWSNSAYYLNLVAPGVNIQSAKNKTQNYIVYSGTSMAAPHVAGAWALLHEAKPNATVQEVLYVLESTGKVVIDSRSGAGGRTTPRIRVNKAIEALLGGPVPAPTEPQYVIVSAYGETELLVNWEGVQREAGYRIERTPYGAGTWETVGTVGIDEAEFIDRDLTCATAYEYRVVAYNLTGDSTPSNGDYSTTLACTGRELLKNRHFEVNTDKNKTVPDIWKVNGKLVGDKVVKDGVNDVSLSGPNAFQFSGGANVTGMLAQNLNLIPLTFNVGDSLTLSGHIDRRSAVAGTQIGNLTVIYSDNKSRKVALKIPSAGSGYQHVSTLPIMLNRSDIKKIVVQLFYKKPKGSFMLDDMSLWQTYGEVSLANLQTTTGEITVPAAPDLRGN